MSASYLKPISKTLKAINPIVVIAVIQIMNLNIKFFFLFFKVKKKAVITLKKNMARSDKARLKTLTAKSQAPKTTSKRH